MSLVNRLLNPAFIFPLLLIALGGWVYYSWSYFPDKQYEVTFPKARQGDVEAQMRLGNMLLVCAHSYRMSTHMLETENWSSLNSFGFLSLCNIKKGKAWMRKAADAGNAEAQYRMALLWITGDEGEALDWIKLAAAQGHALAQGVYGNFYAKDNPAEAYFWYSLGLNDKTEAWHITARDEAKKRLSKEEIAAQDARVKEWKPGMVEKQPEPVKAEPAAPKKQPKKQKPRK